MHVLIGYYVAQRKNVNFFGVYTILVLVLEIFIFFYATFIIYRFLAQLKNDDDLQIPDWRLFSNPIVTGALAIISLVSVSVMAASLFVSTL